MPWYCFYEFPVISLQVSIYGNGDTRQYEVEEKYTQFVNVHSRPVQARLDMGPLAAALNRIDTQRTPGTTWTSPRLIDTGPLLRLDRYGQKLSKSQRYGHPPSRPMFASGLTPEEFEAIVESYFRFGLRGVSPRVGGWPWDALHDLNSGIDWAAWEAELPCLLGERE